MDTTHATASVVGLSDERRLLVERLRRAPAGEAGPAPRPPGVDLLPLGPGQEQMWLIDRMVGGGTLSSAPLCLRLRGRLDVDAVGSAFTALVARHEILRTTIEVVDGAPHQRIGPPVPADFQWCDATDLARVRQLVDDELRHPIELATGPVLRARLFRLAPDDHVLLVVRHHITFDARSDEIMLSDLNELYRAALTGTAASLPPLPVQYADVTQWQRERLTGAHADRLLEFWTANLAGAPARTLLPTSRPAPARRRSLGGFTRRRLSADLVAALHGLAQAWRVTPLMLLLALARVVLWRHTGQRDLLIGTPASVRDRPETQNLIGLFLNMIVLRGDLTGDPTVAELLARERAAVLAAFDHQQLPYAELSRRLGRTVVNPLFSVTVAYDGAPAAGTARLFGLPATPVDAAVPNCEYDLAIRVMPDGDGTAVWWGFNDEVLDRAVVDELADRYVDCLATAVRDPGTRISALPAHRPEWLPFGRDGARDFVPEAGGWRTPDGSLPPGTDLPVVDDLGEPVPEGAVGHLAVVDGPAARYAGLPVRRLRSGVRQLHGYPGGVPAAPNRPGPVSGDAGPTAQIIAGIWRELLDVDPDGMDADLFVIGGHSLTVAQIAVRIEEEFGVAVALADLFDRPTIGAQARLVEDLVLARLAQLGPGALDSVTTPR